MPQIGNRCSTLLLPFLFFVFPSVHARKLKVSAISNSHSLAFCTCRWTSLWWDQHCSSTSANPYPYHIWGNLVLLHNQFTSPKPGSVDSKLKKMEMFLLSYYMSAHYQETSFYIVSIYLKHFIPNPNIYKNWC